MGKPACCTSGLAPPTGRRRKPGLQLSVQGRRTCQHKRAQQMRRHMGKGEGHRAWAQARLHHATGSRGTAAAGAPWALGKARAGPWHHAASRDRAIIAGAAGRLPAARGRSPRRWVGCGTHGRARACGSCPHHGSRAGLRAGAQEGAPAALGAPGGGLAPRLPRSRRAAATADGAATASGARRPPTRRPRRRACGRPARAAAPLAGARARRRRRRCRRTRRRPARAQSAPPARAAPRASAARPPARA
ncbi:MAG: hypothetical protein J3K34DRAFT_420585, partial [Monoraphidium minutum]